MFAQQESSCAHAQRGKRHFSSQPPVACTERVRNILHADILNHVGLHYTTRTQTLATSSGGSLTWTDSTISALRPNSPRDTSAAISCSRSCSTTRLKNLTLERHRLLQLPGPRRPTLWPSLLPFPLRQNFLQACSERPLHEPHPLSLLSLQWHLTMPAHDDADCAKSQPGQTQTSW